MINPATFERLMALSDDELLELDTVEAAQFLIDRQDAQARMYWRGSELSSKGVSWWLDPQAHGMEVRNFFAEKAVPPQATDLLADANRQADVQPAFESTHDSRQALVEARQRAEGRKHTEIAASWMNSIDRVAKNTNAPSRNASASGLWARSIARASGR